LQWQSLYVDKDHQVVSGPEGIAYYGYCIAFLGSKLFVFGKSKLGADLWMLDVGKSKVESCDWQNVDVYRPPFHRVDYCASLVGDVWYFYGGQTYGTDSPGVYQLRLSSE